jgi:hypothetical protein
MAMKPRQLRTVPDSLGGYLRPGGRDHKFLLQTLVHGRPIGTGLVADACLATVQAELMSEAQRQGVETVLDPRSLELSSPGGYIRSGVRDLAWAGPAPHRPADLRGAAGALAVRQIVSAVEAGGYSAVLAPTHHLDGASDPWLAVDAELTRTLRTELNARELRHVLIYYPLITRTAVLLQDEQRARLTAALRGLPIDALWLRLHPFGTTTSGPLALRRYLEVCRHLHALQVPLVAEHSGTIGVALLAFGAVGGIESGITYAENVNLTPYLVAPKPGSKGFAPAPRVYLQEIGSFLENKATDNFFAARGMKTLHGCHDTACCPRSWRDMQLKPREHFVHQRAREVSGLSAIPEALRPGRYMETFLRPATDRVLRAAEIEPSLTRARKRLESWRGTLGADLDAHSTFTISPPAAGKPARRSA